MIDLTGLPIEIDVADMQELNLRDPKAFTMKRKEGLGASDIAAVLGLSPYKSKHELIKEKMSKEITADELAIGENINVRKGHDLEPLIIDKFSDATGHLTVKPTAQYRMIDHPHIKINFDGVADIVGHYIPVEIKFVSARGEKHYDPTKAFFNERSGFNPTPVPKEEVANYGLGNMAYVQRAKAYGVPIQYYTQLQMQILGLQAPYGFIAVLGEKDWVLNLYQIPADLQIQNDAMLESFKLWQFIDVK